MHNLTSTEPEAVREWLRAICHEANMTSTQLARACGLPPPTINRFLNATKGAPKNLNANTISRIQRMTERLLSPSKSLKRGASAHVPSSNVTSTGRRWTIRSVEVIGAVEAGERRAAAEWPAGDRYLWPAPIEAEYQSNFVVGLEIKDDSVDVIYPIGTIVTCVAFTELGRGPRPGERVVMHRTNEDGEIEVTVREYYIDQDANAWLLSRTSRPDLQESIALGQHKTPLPKGIKIPYRITGSFRPE